MSDDKSWYLAQGEEQRGPYSTAQLTELARRGDMSAETFVWADGMAEWLPASQVEGLLPALPASPAPAGTPIVVPSAPNPYAPGNIRFGTAGGESYPPVGVSAASFGLWIGLWIGGISLMIVPAVIGATLVRTTGSPAPMIVVMGLFVAGWVCTIVAGILNYIYLYRAWRCLEFGGYARTTPGKAIGFLFIPFFNLYWIFQSIYGLSVDWNQTADAYGDLHMAPRLSQGIFLTFCICLFIPYVNLLNAIFGPILMSQVCSGVNFFAYRPTRPTGPLGFNLH